MLSILYKFLAFFFFQKILNMMLEISLLSILDCFNSKKDGTPTTVKSEIKEFFKKLDEVEHCFYNNSQVLYTYVYNSADMPCKRRKSLPL